MKCYYEELDIGRDANESDIKCAYRKLALKWHPDKNPNSMEVAKERFQIIQQAYEVLSDPQERAWYDNHREQILRGKNSDYEDNCLDVFQYFTVACFAGFGDDDKGFYAIYREVFEKISAEDADFMDCEEFLKVPKFGDSKCNYEDIVGPFYAYWSAYCTKRTYTWLCPYDIKDIKDRRILREIDKKMKKIVQNAKKDRNEQVRNLVSFVRKRDKRVLAYKRLLEERTAFNKQKQEQNRLEQIKRRQQELEETRLNSQIANANNDDYEEQLKQLVQQYSSDDEYYEDDELRKENLDEENINGLYCVACNKEFKTDKSFANHETSKKHRDNIERIKVEMNSEEDMYQNGENFLETEEFKMEESEERNDMINEDTATSMKQNKSNKTRRKEDGKNVKQLKQLNLNEENSEEIQKKHETLDITDQSDEDWDTTNKKSTRKFRNKIKVNKNKSNLFEPFQANIESKSASETESKIYPLKSEINQHICATCKSIFESKNKLFSHLKLTNHSVFMPKEKLLEDEKAKTRRGKLKKKK